MPIRSCADGWVSVDVRAAALNHHDIFSLRGVGLGEDKLPMILGCDAAGVTADGAEVVVHAVIADPDRGRGDETLDPKRSLLSEVYPGTLAEKVAVPARNLVAEAGRAVVGRGRLGLDGVADGVPDAVHEGRGAARADGARPRRGWGSRHRRRSRSAGRPGSGSG